MGKSESEDKPLSCASHATAGKVFSLEFANNLPHRQE